MIILGIFSNFNEKYLRDPPERGYGLFMCRVHEIFSGEFRLKRPYDRCRHYRKDALQRIGDERLKKLCPPCPLRGFIVRQFFGSGLNMMSSCRFSRAKKIFFIPFPYFGHVRNRIGGRYRTIIVSIRGIFDIFQAIVIGSFSRKGHERVFAI
jgi:hypothetical protein